MKTTQVLVIGAGASGLMAGIAAARSGAEVVIAEQKDRPGRKILATGNGRCNFTNAYMDAACYHDNAFAMQVIRQFPGEQTLAFFRELGIYPSAHEGYYYPASMQASSVLQALLGEAERAGVKIMNYARAVFVQAAGHEAGGFRVRIERTIPEGIRQKKKKNGKLRLQAESFRTEEEEWFCSRLILAGGGKAYASLGSDGSCYDLARSLGHHIVKPLPALTGIRCREDWFRDLAGVRVDAKVSLYEDTGDGGLKLLASDQGQVQFTEYGISGIPVFQVSRYAAIALDQGRSVKAGLDFFPEISREELSAYLRQHNPDQYTGLFPDKLLSLLLQIMPGKLDQTLYCTCMQVNDFDKAQVTCGGISLEEIDSRTMESKICPGLYIAGEAADVDGICGGYNLQWAWSSGYLAGLHAAGAHTAGNHGAGVHAAE